MAVRPARICSCGKRVPSGMRCACQQARERERPTARQRGYTTEWQKAAKTFLAQPGHERCVTCGAPATVVDHRIAHKGDQRLFWDSSNWQPMCRRCNTAKANQREGGFGHAIR